MAISYVQRTFGGVAKDVLVVRGTAGTEEILVKESLFGPDFKFLDEVDATAGADFDAKLQACVLSTGVKATLVFDSRIKFTVDLQAKAAKNVVEADVVAAVQALQTDVTDLDVRVTDLETP